MTPSAAGAAGHAAPALGRFHLLAWRWHFYAGLYVVPFLLMLALTGLVMVFFTGFQHRLGMTIDVTPQAQTATVTEQAPGGAGPLAGARSSRTTWRPKTPRCPPGSRCRLVTASRRWPSTRTPPR